MKKKILFALGIATVFMSANMANLWAFIDDTGLVLYFPLNKMAGEGEDVKDASGNGNDGEIVGNVEEVDGKFGFAFKFKGGFIKVPDSDGMDGVEELTLQAWVKQETLEEGGIIGKMPPCCSTSYKLLAGDKIKFSAPGNTPLGAENIAEAQAPPVGEWYHVAATFDRGKLELYINGRMEDSAVVSAQTETLTDLLTPVSIGARMFTGDLLLEGSIDEVAIWSRVLSEDEIKESMQRGLSQSFAVEPMDKLAISWGSIKF